MKEKKQCVCLYVRTVLLDSILLISDCVLTQPISLLFFFLLCNAIAPHRNSLGPTHQPIHRLEPFSFVRSFESILIAHTISIFILKSIVRMLFVFIIFCYEYLFVFIYVSSTLYAPAS